MPFLSRPANRRGTDAASSAIARGTSTICSTPRLQRPTTRASGSRKPGAVSTRLRTATPRLVCGRRRSLLVRCAQCRLRRVADNMRARSVQPISSCASQGSPTPGASTLEVTAVYATEPSPPENGQVPPRMLPCTDGGERAARLVRREAGQSFPRPQDRSPGIATSTTPTISSVVSLSTLSPHGGSSTSTARRGKSPVLLLSKRCPTTTSRRSCFSTSASFRNVRPNHSIRRHRAPCRLPACQTSAAPGKRKTRKVETCIRSRYRKYGCGRMTASEPKAAADRRRFDCGWSDPGRLPFLDSDDASGVRTFRNASPLRLPDRGGRTGSHAPEPAHALCRRARRGSFVDRNVVFAGVDALQLTFLERAATRRGRRRSANA